MRHVKCIPLGSVNMPAPFVQAYFYIPKIDYGCPTTFIMDTGSDVTCIHGPLALKLNPKLVGCEISDGQGVGGSCPYYWEQAIVIFWDNNGDYFEPLNSVRLGIQLISHEIDDDQMKLSNVLGRDILSKGNFIYNAPDNVISFCFPDNNTQKASRKPV